MLGIEVRDRHSRIGIWFVVRGVFGTHFEVRGMDGTRIGQTVDGETQVRQHVIVDDVVEEHGIRIEGVLRQDDAIVECSVLSDDRSPLRCEDEHRQFLARAL